MKKKILLVEDEKNFGAVLRDYLSLNGFEVTLCDDGIKGINAFKSDVYDLCILDVMMPKKDGFTLASEIRDTEGIYVPIIFLSARSLKEDMIKGYKTGADDYLVKPFDTELLLFKIKAILSRGEIDSHQPKDGIYKMGNIVFNYRLRTLKYTDGEEIKLSPKEAELLQLLCSYKNDILPRAKALKMIWKEVNYFTGRSMDVYIVKLRKYLARENNVEIVSLHGNGYRLMEKGTGN